MSWHDDQPVVTPPAAPEPAPSIPPLAGLRRTAIAALGALLLIGGGVAAVSAASPEPSDTPSATQGTDGATVQPDASAQPERVGPDGRDCPDKDGRSGTDDGGGSDSSTDSDSDATQSDV